jgi:hypothetical protein
VQTDISGNPPVLSCKKSSASWTSDSALPLTSCGISLFHVSLQYRIDVWIKANQTWPIRQSTSKLINHSIHLRDCHYNCHHRQFTQGSVISSLITLPCPLNSASHSYSKSTVLTYFGVGGCFLPRSIAMMTTVCLLGIGAAVTQVAATQGTGMAVWKSSRSGKKVASGQSDMGSAGSLLGPSTQVPWV